MRDTITPRVPKIDWSRGFARHWNGSSAATHIFNAFSFLFPDGERYFIQVARECADGLDFSAQPGLDEAVASFVAQEALHSQQHARYNAVLEQQGYVNVVHAFVEGIRRYSFQHYSALTRLGIVCAYEHYTAVLANYLLRNSQVIARATPEMATMWGWHAAEETEHKSVCFDLYHAAGGGWSRRVLTYLMVSMNFTIMFTRLYSNMLYRDGMFRLTRLPRTLLEVLSLFYGRHGVGWHLLGYSIAYMSPHFHPWQQANRPLMMAWLEANKQRLRVVGAGLPPEPLAG